MKYEITKEIYEQIKNYIEDVKEEIDNFNEENGRLFGFNDVVEVRLEKHFNFEKQAIVYELKVNWSAVGNMSIEDTKKFMQALSNATEYAEKLNIQISEKIENAGKEDEITTDFEVVNLEGYMFEDENGQTVAYPENTFGFMIDDKFVSDVCKSGGGSSLPLAYGRKIAREIKQGGLVVSELAFCKPVGIY